MSSSRPTSWKYSSLGRSRKAGGACKPELALGGASLTLLLSPLWGSLSHHVPVSSLTLALCLGSLGGQRMTGEPGGLSVGAQNSTEHGQRGGQRGEGQTRWAGCLTVDQCPTSPAPSLRDSRRVPDSHRCGHSGKHGLGSPSSTPPPAPQPGVHTTHPQPPGPPLLAHPERHLEQHSGHWGGPCGAQTVVGCAGVLSQGVLIAQGDDQRAFWALGPARELEGRGGNGRKKLSGGEAAPGRTRCRKPTAAWTGLHLQACLPGLLTLHLTAGVTVRSAQLQGAPEPPGPVTNPPLRPSNGHDSCSQPRCSRTIAHSFLPPPAPRRFLFNAQRLLSPVTAEAPRTPGSEAGFQPRRDAPSSSSQTSRSNRPGMRSRSPGIRGSSSRP